MCDPTRDRLQRKTEARSNLKCQAKELYFVSYDIDIREPLGRLLSRSVTSSTPEGLEG